jgi:hypothetical protein
MDEVKDALKNYTACQAVIFGIAFISAYWIVFYNFRQTGEGQTFFNCKRHIISYWIFNLFCPSYNA